MNFDYHGLEPIACCKEPGHEAMERLYKDFSIIRYDGMNLLDLKKIDKNQLSHLSLQPFKHTPGLNECKSEIFGNLDEIISGDCIVKAVRINPLTSLQVQGDINFIDNDPFHFVEGDKRRDIVLQAYNDVLAELKAKPF